MWVARSDIVTRIPSYLERQLGLPWFAFSNGLFTSWMLSSLHGIDANSSTIRWAGRGDQLVTFTHLRDVAAFVQLAVSRVPVPQPGTGRWLYVESFRATFNDVFAEAQRLDGTQRQWIVTRSSADDARQTQTSDSEQGEIAWHLALFDDGDGLRAENDNKLVGLEPKYDFAGAVQETLLQERKSH